MENIEIKFKYKVKPSKFIFTQQTDYSLMSRKLFLYYNDDKFETLDLLLDKDPQEFVLRQPYSTKKLKVVLENTNGGTNLGANISMMGFKCINLAEEEKLKIEEENKKLGSNEKPKEVKSGCNDTLDSMTSDEQIVSCAETCELNPDKVVEVDQGYYKMDSSVCIAAKLFYKGKPEANQKSFGVKRVKNDKRLPDGSKPD